MNARLVGSTLTTHNSTPATKSVTASTGDTVRAAVAYDAVPLRLGVTLFAENLVQPGYATNGFFYVFYVGLNGNVIVERLSATPGANVANPSGTPTIVISIPHGGSEHHGGMIEFGPDGMFYLAPGDGACCGDPRGNAQNRFTMLGKILRINVRSLPYVVPTDNPFVAGGLGLPEIWAYGLRNGWRFSFDAPSGMLFIGDVGQDAHEEVNAVSVRAAGLNFGWPFTEGNACYNPATNCVSGRNLTLPVIDYAHSDGCSVIGGFVYRGAAIPELVGHYLYADFCRGWLRSFQLVNGRADELRSWAEVSLPFTNSFGKDGAHGGAIGGDVPVQVSPVRPRHEPFACHGRLADLARTGDEDKGVGGEPTEGGRRLDLRSGPIARALAAEPERLHDTLDATAVNRWVVIDEVQRVPAILDAVHQRMDREPVRRFLLTGSSARSLQRAGVNLLGGRAGRRIMSPFLAAELGAAFSVAVAQRIGLLPVIWTAESPEQALADYATVAVFDEVRAEARVRQIDGFARALEQLALSHGSVISPTAIAQLAAVKKSTVIDWIDVLESMFLIARVPVFSARPSRRALAAQPKLYFADTGIAAAFRPTDSARAAPDAIGASREGLVYQHLAAWCEAERDARLTTWRTTGGVEVDLVVETSNGLVAIEVKSGHTLRPADRRGLLAFHDEFPEARLIALADVPLAQQQGPITVLPLTEFLLGIVPGAPLPA